MQREGAIFQKDLSPGVCCPMHVSILGIDVAELANGAGYTQGQHGLENSDTATNTLFSA